MELQVIIKDGQKYLACPLWSNRDWYWTCDPEMAKRFTLSKKEEEHIDALKHDYLVVLVQSVMPKTAKLVIIEADVAKDGKPSGP